MNFNADIFGDSRLAVKGQSRSPKWPSEKSLELSTNDNDGFVLNSRLTLTLFIHVNSLPRGITTRLRIFKVGFQLDTDH